MSKNKRTQLKSEFRPRNQFQEKLTKSIREKDIILAEGPAGVGKTFASVGLACRDLAEGRVDRIIIARPAVTVDEDLGYLPGTAEDKINPYLRPVFDALAAFISPEQLVKHIENGVIEVAPIGFMRGRTFSYCFVIMDEAQNATKQQMKMFLTRAGEKSKYIIQGDSSQSDLNGDSGFKDVIGKLEECPVVDIIVGRQEEVIRSHTVKELLKYL